MKIAVYDRYWPTAGGGEKFAAGVASVLAADHDVTLLAHEPVDLTALGERLAVDLAGLRVEVVGGAGRVESASAAYDLLVNVSFRSADRCGARHGLYVVHFPQRRDEDVPRRQRALLDRLGPVIGGRTEPFTTGPGFHPPNVVRWWKVRWTDGDGELAVAIPPGRATTLHLLFGSVLPPGVELEATVEVDGHAAGSVAVGPPRSKKDAALPRRLSVPATGHADGSPVSLRIRSAQWRPGEVLGNGDDRSLGVPLVGVAVGARPLSWGRALVSLFETHPLPLDFLDTYDRILANSAFTRRWIRTWWDRDSGVLYPPVTLRPAPPAAKRPVVLSVGRFFGPERGHSKKQLELVQAWRALLDRPGARALVDAEGWRLHLVGGCNPLDRPYLDAVRGAAEGLPVDLHPDAPIAELDRLYREASIFWHAGGLGEDEQAHPDRMEHFGITTLEAMSAGVVPVAYAAAGPLEAFTDGVEGHHFRNLDGLVEATERLLEDPGTRATMAAAAADRAADFGMDAFATRLRRQVETLC
jgi:glycosyltransferase involved in cell wall biosynthesis